MGQVADTSLRALQKEQRNLRYPLRLQRWLFFRKAKGTHGVHSPLAYALATKVLLKPDAQPLEMRLRRHFADHHFQTVHQSDLEQALAESGLGKPVVFYIPDLLPDRKAWLRVCADARVSMAVDCFDFGLLICNPAIREQQYLRQKYRP